MHAVLPLTLLVWLVLWKPQEFVPALAGLPLLEAALGASFVGLAMGRKVGALRVVWPAHGTLAIALFGWAAVGRVVQAGAHRLSESLRELGIALALYFAIALCAPTLRAVAWITQALLVGCLAVGLVGLHQGLSPLGCALQEGETLETLRPDGRPCVEAVQCLEGGEPGALYRCERVGLFDTVTVGGGRIRYRGVLKDPNELALATATAAPLLFGWAHRRERGVIHQALAWIGVMAIGAVVVLTQSRAGLIVLTVALGARHVLRYGKRALVAAIALGAMLVALGGRSTDEASASSTERRELLGTALHLFTSHPISGVGYGRFTDFSELTAHNAYALVLAELGMVGLVAFVTLLAVSIAIPLDVLRATRRRPEAASVRALATAQLGMMTATVTGAFFLSVPYHQLVWLQLGLTGALASAVRAHLPALEIRLDRPRLATIALVSLAVPLALALASRGAHG